MRAGVKNAGSFALDGPMAPVRRPRVKFGFAVPSGNVPDVSMRSSVKRIDSTSGLAAFSCWRNFDCGYAGHCRFVSCD
jgi:hypothetical protein